MMAHSQHSRLSGKLHPFRSHMIQRLQSCFQMTSIRIQIIIIIIVIIIIATIYCCYYYDLYHKLFVFLFSLLLFTRSTVSCYSLPGGSKERPSEATARSAKARLARRPGAAEARTWSRADPSIHLHINI